MTLRTLPRLAHGRIVTGVLLLCAASANAQSAAFFYTDKPGYSAGETLRIHASTPASMSIDISLLRLGREPWTEVARVPGVNVSPKALKLGSFVEFPTLDMTGMGAFTLEGWWYPTVVGGDTVVLAGQASATAAGAALGVDIDGRPIAAVNGTIVTATSALPRYVWHHLAATYDSSALSLFVDGTLAASGSRTGPVVATGLPFRLGARAEAPGNLTGIIDGRIDSWALWPRALSPLEISARKSRGLNESNPLPATNEVTLFAGFEDLYGTGVSDASATPHLGNIVNHGTPHVSGPFGTGKALRLGHDQLVDADWPVTTSFVIPTTLKSGLFAVRSAPAGTPLGDLAQHFFSAVVVRPIAPTPGVKVAVIVPVNTWNAYNGWPGDPFGDGPAGLTPRAPRPGGTVAAHPGNNSAYATGGDSISSSFFMGWKRPNLHASIVAPSRLNDGGVAPVGVFSHDAPLSLDLVRWLDEKNIPYDVYSDLDVERGRFPVAGPYKVMIIHGHSEYWSQNQLDATNAYLDYGGSLVNLSGNTLTWRVAHGPDVMEVRKWPHYSNIGKGYADIRSAIDDQRIGLFRVLEICNGGGGRDFVLGTTNNVGSPACPESSPTCFGQWSVMNSGHWLWQSGGVDDGQVFGKSRANANIVGHEFDTFEPTHLPLGLAAGTAPVVLGVGVNFGGDIGLLNYAAIDANTCAQFEQAAGSSAAYVTSFPAATAKGGNIVYYRHRGGGRVLSVAAVATASALGADSVLTGIVSRALDCFANDVSCGDVSLPAGTDGGGADGGGAAGGGADGGGADGGGADGGGADGSGADGGGADGGGTDGGGADGGGGGGTSPGKPCGCSAGAGGMLAFLMLVCFRFRRSR